MTQSIGPPSLAQGTRIAVGFSTSISRFIPACGELSKPSWAIVQLDGSSPLARGTQPLTSQKTIYRRFIPAYAGNSVSEYREKCGIAVHPRLRGELFFLFPTSHSSSGSSPLTRGTPAKQLAAQNQSRFIPAYAGNSHGILPLSFFISVHPRLRGELAMSSVSAFFTNGSSPLTRGTLHVKVKITLEPRFIPAYAGNSSASEARNSDHRFIPAYAGNSGNS